jgi:hypothetical protein
MIILYPFHLHHSPLMNCRTISIDRLYALPHLRIYPIMAACIATPMYYLVRLLVSLRH